MKMSEIPFGWSHILCPGGQTIELAVRITDRGNYDWRDSSTFPGRKRMPPSHAFGGITGNVTLKTASVAMTDLYMQNLPEIT